ncbi:sodium-dependent multivitamin transporter-like [Argopecten irradians]|uniref:sodium-dependent multivitamin transporter-like n=1 Tax=Argopecten irradians TaxID=31199 RepID=UPI003720EE6A
MSESEIQGFVALDYVVFVSILLVSIGIGVYQACCKPKQDTIKQYILADRKLNILPVAMSMTVSFQSSIMLLGNPAEIYVYGIPFMWQAIGLVLSNYLPYAPLFHLSIRSKSPVCTRLCIWGSSCLDLESQSKQGGMKAVVWSNVFQFLVVFAGIFSIIIQLEPQPNCTTLVLDTDHRVVYLAGLPLTYPGNHTEDLFSSYTEGRTKILPYLVVVLFRDIPGMAGVFVAAVFSASLSAITSLLSSLSAQTVVDIIRPLVKDISEAKATLIAKLCVPAYGIIGIGISFVIAEIEGPLSEIVYCLLSSFGGASAGMFFFAAYCPWANSKGVITGGLTGMELVMWIALGQSFSPTRLRAQTLPPVSTDQCWGHNQSLLLGNATTLTQPTTPVFVSSGNRTKV